MVDPYLQSGGEVEFLVEGGYLAVEGGVVAEVGLRGEPAGTYLMLNTGDPYLSVENPVLHSSTSRKAVPEAVKTISNNLNGASSVHRRFLLR